VNSKAGSSEANFLWSLSYNRRNILFEFEKTAEYTLYDKNDLHTFLINDEGMP
jgi:hypothetical protein